MTSDGKMDCCVIAADLEEILANEDLQEKLLDKKDIQELNKISSSKKEEVLEEVKSKGITSWNLGRGYLPRWDISKQEFEQALEKKVCLNYKSFPTWTITKWGRCFVC